MAAQYGQAGSIKVLSALHTNVNTPKPDGSTPIYIAAQHGHVEALRALYIAGGDLNQCNSIGIKPLYIAAYMKHGNIIKLLCRLGADMHECYYSDTSMYATDATNNTTNTSNNTTNIYDNEYDNIDYNSANSYIKEMILNLSTECEYCNSFSDKLLVCSGCEKVRYCSRECQTKHRKQHKHECKK